jgi:hypothetical protein
MAHEGGTSLKWLMCHAAAVGDEDERDKRERERVGWQKDDKSVKVVLLHTKLTTSYPT